MSNIAENPYIATPQLSPGDEKLWATIIHVAGAVSYIFAAWAGYLIFRNRGPFVRDNTRNALNWQISFLIYYAAGLLLSLILIGYLVVIAAVVLSIVFSIQAAIAANRGQPRPALSLPAVDPVPEDAAVPSAARGSYCIARLSGLSGLRAAKPEGSSASSIPRRAGDAPLRRQAGAHEGSAGCCHGSPRPDRRARRR